MDHAESRASNVLIIIHTIWQNHTMLFDLRSMRTYRFSCYNDGWLGKEFGSRITFGCGSYIFICIFATSHYIGLAHQVI